MCNCAHLPAASPNNWELPLLAVVVKPDWFPPWSIWESWSMQDWNLELSRKSWLFASLHNWVVLLQPDSYFQLEDFSLYKANAKRQLIVCIILSQIPDILEFNILMRNARLCLASSFFGLRYQQQEYGFLITRKVWQFKILIRFAWLCLASSFFRRGFSCLVLLLPGAATSQ